MVKDDIIKTGYPHIDKPWLQFYDKRIIGSEDPRTNLTHYLRMRNIGRLNLEAGSYYGKGYTFNDLFDRAKKAAQVFSGLGVKKGDIIMNLMPNVPDAGYMLLGATLIGAASDFIDPRPDSMDMVANAKKVLEIIKYEKAKYIVALDICYVAMLKPIEEELKELGIDTIITVNAADSMDLVGKINYLKETMDYNTLRNRKITSADVKKLTNLQAVLEKIKTMKEGSKALKEAIKTSPLKVVSYQQLLKECSSIDFTEVRDEKLVNYIGHTSGTSGARPKPISLTNECGISTLEQLIKGDVSFKPGERALNILPFFAPFGTYDNYFLNLVSGASNIHIPEFDISEFGYLLKKYHPNIVMATPAWISALPSYEYLDKEDFECITKIIYGGDSMTAKDEELVNKWLREHGSKAEVEKGYGMSEFCGCGTYAQKGYNPFESIGIPLPNTIIGIVDPNVDDKLVPLKFEEGMDRLIGEAVVSSKAVTGGTIHGDIIVPHYELDGLDVIRTRDIVEMDRNGIFYHDGRKDRSFTRFDGYKIKPREIEREIEKSPYVKYACLVPYFDEAKRGIMPICHLVLNEEVNEDEIKVIEQIVYEQIIGNHDMSSRQIPAKFKIRVAMPLTAANKTNFKLMEQEGLDGTEINVDVEETNLSVGKINIYRNGLKRELK